ncbi:hypothetical protein Pint_19045 [Pistacia integerrima]|uniref:Uncharacterized protein n=1 Tax=Pistacia integerrima TaxID=434235 RepID=A0ACC0YWG9_9ROSI|nr:hypothetical protein Pint_19045 [Pistacia integerrima]
MVFEECDKEYHEISSEMKRCFTSICPPRHRKLSTHHPLKGNAPLPKSIALDTTCYLTVDSPANIVAKGTIMEYEGSNVWVTMDVVSKKVVKKKYATPKKVPKKSESVYDKVDFDMEIEDIDPLGNELAIIPVKSKPQQMKVDKKRTNLGKRKAKVTPLKMKKIRQSVVSKKFVKKKYATPKKVPKKSESVYDKIDFDMEIEDIDPLGNELAITTVKSEPQQMKVDKKRTSLGKRKVEVTPLKMKKIQQSVVPERHIVQNNPSLKMFSIMVNRLIPNKQIVRVQTDDNLFGYDSYTYLTKEDFERVLNMEELTASCITVYIM